jgi:hypothetical protein
MKWRPRDPESYFKVRTVWPSGIYVKRAVKKPKKVEKK